MADAEPFDRAVRRHRRDRAAAHFDRFAFLKDAMTAELLARATDTGREFVDALDLGCHDGRLGRSLSAEHVTCADAGESFARAAGGICCDEDRLPFCDGMFDLIASAGSLQAVNDLPGALVQIRRALRPGGLFLAAFPGGESLREIRACFLEAESALTGRAAARIAPMVDVAAAGALLQRAGFNMPVADVDTVTVRYASLFAALDDLRGMGESNVLTTRAPLRRDVLADAAVRFASMAQPDGKTAVTVQIIYLTGWAATGDPAALGERLKQRLQ